MVQTRNLWDFIKNTEILSLPARFTFTHSPIRHKLLTFISIISLGLKKVMCPSVFSTRKATRPTNTTQPATAPRMLILLCISYTQVLMKDK